MREHAAAGSMEGGERGWWRMERAMAKVDGRTVRQPIVNAYNRHIISSRDLQTDMEK